MMVVCRWTSWLLFLPFVLLAIFVGAESQSCQLPQGLRNRAMVSSTAGPVDTTDGSVTFVDGLTACTHTMCTDKLKPLKFDCEQVQGDVYFFKSVTITEAGNDFNLYICWYINQQVSSDKWVYYQGPKDKNGFYNSYVTANPSSTPKSFNEVCDLGSPLPVSKYALLLDKASLTSQSSSCPDAMLATFDAKQTSTSCVTEYDVCRTSTRQSIDITKPDCREDEFFSANGKMDCLHSLSQNDVTYVTTFTPENGTVSFGCMAYIEDNDHLYANLSASTCAELQAPTKTTHEVSFAPKAYPCTFPNGLLGMWRNSRKSQEVNVTETKMDNFFSCTTNPPCSLQVDSLECYRTDNSRYLIRTQVLDVSSVSVRVYMCLELSQLSSTKYLYRLLHQNLDATLNDYVVTFNPGQSVTLSQACDDLSVDPYPATRHHVFVKSGEETNSFSTCPAGLLGEFNNPNAACQSTYTTCDDSSQLKVTGTACTPKPFFSDGGSVGCLHSVKVSDTTYVTLYNSDASPDGTTTFAFTCVALKASGITLKLSQNPYECIDSQTSGSITTPIGSLFQYEKTDDSKHGNKKIT
ncbi:uncharacterized protein LOC143283802 [Babylonia areolata]|uniref:uncharacterized protein LOC143283802 n=1 Tax=Babylonia areolata TaxID=304850 RepID=UPI003FD49744